MTQQLVIDHVSKVFGGLKAVADVTMTIEQGTLIALIGPNGAGKTTLFNMLTGESGPSSGTITLYTADGPVDITKKKAYQVAKLGVARTFQNIRLFGAMTVKENVLVARTHLYRESFIGTMLRFPQFYQQEAAVAAAADELLDFFELADVADEPTASLPYGTQRRVEIVRAVATKPQLLFLDEPAAGMNPEETADLGRLITRIREHFGITVVLIEHDMSLVMKLAESIYVLDHGAMIASGTPNEIQTNAQVISAYLGGENHA
ncbi:ABC transporter ATP-binding protein [Lacticaseibacillus paracasei]|uniref:ABC transporter ATP-binding protein n=1 Tax=Lacticaseibacillus paracasei TaxID=1597 RepID=UPI003981D2B0